MSDTLCEAQNLLRNFIAPPIAGESMKVRVARAARYVGFTYSRTFTLWYKNARRVEAEEIELLRAAAVKRAAQKAEKTNVGRDFWAEVYRVRKQLEEQREIIDQIMERMSQDSRQSDPYSGEARKYSVRQDGRSCLPDISERTG